MIFYLWFCYLFFFDFVIYGFVYLWLFMYRFCYPMILLSMKSPKDKNQLKLIEKQPWSFVFDFSDLSLAAHFQYYRRMRNISGAYSRICRCGGGFIFSKGGVGSQYHWTQQQTENHRFHWSRGRGRGEPPSSQYLSKHVHCATSYCFQCEIGRTILFLFLPATPPTHPRPLTLDSILIISWTQKLRNDKRRNNRYFLRWASTPCVNCCELAFLPLICSEKKVNLTPLISTPGFLFGFLVFSAVVLAVLLLLCTAHCTIAVQYTLAVHWTLYTEHCTLNNVHWTLYTEHCTLNTVHCTLNTVHWTLYTKHCTLNTIHWTLYTKNTEHCTLYLLYTLHCTL